MLHAMLCDPSLYLDVLVQIQCYIGKWRSHCRCQQMLHGTDILCSSPSCNVLSHHSQILPQKNKIKIFVKGRLRLEKKPLHFFFSTDKVNYMSREPIFHAKLWLYSQICSNSVAWACETTSLSARAHGTVFCCCFGWTKYLKCGWDI